MRLLICGGLLFAPFALRAQTADSLPERIRNCHLPADLRQELDQLWAARDYTRMGAILKAQANHPDTSAGSADLLALAGAVEFLGGHLDRAAVAYGLSDAIVPLADPDRFTWAMAFITLGDAQAARAQLTQLATKNQERPLYLYWLARIDYDQRLYTEAVAKLKRVIALDPSWMRAYDNLGLAFDMLGQPDEAREAFEKAVDLNRKLPQPSCWPPHNLGALLLRLQKLKEAESALRECLRYDATFSTGHYHLARVLEAEGRENEAMDEYRAATSHDPPVVEAFYSLGLLYRRNGRTAEAESTFAEYKRRKAESPQ